MEPVPKIKLICKKTNQYLILKYTQHLKVTTKKKVHANKLKKIFTSHF